MTETQASLRRGEVLGRIVSAKREEVARLRESSHELWAKARSAPPVRNFAGALSRSGQVALIGEVKRRSPGAGDIRPDLEPARWAKAYEVAGAAAVSVLTDGPFFGGDLGDLADVRAAVALPILRKDFTLDDVQVAEARGAGADAVLLIVRILDDERLRGLLDAARELDLSALVEVHDEADLERALAAGATVVGVNNRDLRTFEAKIDVTLELVESVPPGVVVVSESGIRTRDEVALLGRCGVHAVLVGEFLLRQPDPAVAAARLVGCRRSDRGNG